MPAFSLYPAPMSPLPLLPFVLLLACAETSPRPPVIKDCPAAMAAEKELAVREGRAPVPIVQPGRLLTDILQEKNRPAVTLAMMAGVKGATLKTLARISVSADGRVDAVEVLKSSGVRSFDEAVMEKMKTWTYQPSTINCRPVPYAYPANWEHRFAP